MELLTYAPVASLKGFPGNALPGEWLLEALVLAAFAHQVRKDEAFAKEARRFVLEGGYQGSGELVSGLKERLFAARPELADLAVADLPLEGVERRRILVWDLEGREVVGDREAHSFPLRLGDYAEDHFRTWLLPFYRIKEVAEVLRKRLGLNPWPRRLYAWKEVSLGWVFLESGR
jgi:hypothetical protein